MKKTLSLALLCLAFTACQKAPVSDSSDQDQPKYKVEFKVSAGSVSLVKSGSTNSKVTDGVSEPVTTHADKIFYRVYNNGGEFVKSIDQDKSSPTFGTITDQLPTGFYNVRIVAGKGSTLFSTKNDELFYKAHYGVTDRWEETFLGEIPVVVNGSAISQSVELQRTVGGIELNIEDAIPTNVSKIGITCEKEALTQYYNGTFDGKSVSVEKLFDVAPSAIGTKNTTYLMYVGNVTQGGSPVTIKAYGSDNKVIAQKAIGFVPIQKNHKAILTGTLFGTVTQPGGFNITVNTEWDASGTPIKF